MIVNWCSKQRRYPPVGLHLPVKGVSFVPIVPLPLGNLPQSGVGHHISHRRERWERQLACLACKCRFITSHRSVRTHTLWPFSQFCCSFLCLFSFHIHSAVCSRPFTSALSKFKQFKSIKVSLISQANSVFVTLQNVWNLLTKASSREDSSLEGSNEWYRSPSDLSVSTIYTHLLLLPWLLHLSIHTGSVSRVSVLSL